MPPKRSNKPKATKELAIVSNGDAAVADAEPLEDASPKRKRAPAKSKTASKVAKNDADNEEMANGENPVVTPAKKRGSVKLTKAAQKEVPAETSSESPAEAKPKMKRAPAKKKAAASVIDDIAEPAQKEVPAETSSESPAKAKPKTKRAPAKKNAAASVTDEATQNEIPEPEQEAQPKKKRAPTKKAAASKSLEADEPAAEDADNDTKPVGRKTQQARAKGATKASKKELPIDEAQESIDPPVVEEVVLAKKRAAPKKKTQAVAIESDDPPAKATPVKKAAASRRKKVDADPDSESAVPAKKRSKKVADNVEPEGEEEEVAKSPAKKTVSRKKASKDGDEIQADSVPAKKKVATKKLALKVETTAEEPVVEKVQIKKTAKGRKAVKITHDEGDAIESGATKEIKPKKGRPKKVADEKPTENDIHSESPKPVVKKMAAKRKPKTSEEVTSDVTPTSPPDEKPLVNGIAAISPKPVDTNVAAKRKPDTDEELTTEEASPSPKATKKPKLEVSEEASLEPEAPAVDTISSFDIAKNYKMKISTWNVAGLRAMVKKEGMAFLEKQKPDIFCMQEIKCLSDEVPDVAKVKGYHYYWHSKPGGRAGVALYSKVMPYSVEYGIGDDEQDSDGRLITAEYSLFYLVCVYVPNSGRQLVTLPKRMRWNILFENHLRKLNAKKPVIVCGDLNVSHLEIDLANPKANRRSAGFTEEERTDMTQLLDSGFVDTFRMLYPDRRNAYTYWTYMANARARNIGWRLDYFLVSERLQNKVVDNVIQSQVKGSDHCPITLFINI